MQDHVHVPFIVQDESADVPGFISPSTSRTKSSLIPTELAATEPMPLTTAPTAAPASGAATTRPAMKPTAVQARLLDSAGNGSWPRDDSAHSLPCPSCARGMINVRNRRAAA